MEETPKDGVQKIVTESWEANEMGDPSTKVQWILQLIKENPKRSIIIFAEWYVYCLL